MHFTWNEPKNRSNSAKHGISFETAVSVFDDPAALSRLECIVDDEERWQTIGIAGGSAILLVAHTWRDIRGEQMVRIISARKATPGERTLYEEAF